MESKLYNNPKGLENHHKTLNVAFKYNYNGEDELEHEFEIMTLSKMLAHLFKFNDLKWTLVYSDSEDGRIIDRFARAVVNFTNGYYISIINSMNSHGAVDEYELAILNKDGITYSTPLADDVVGCLTPEGVEQFVRDVSELPDYDKQNPDL